MQWHARVFFIHIHCHSCWCIRIEWIRLESMQWFHIHCRSCWCNDMRGCFLFTFIGIPADAIRIEMYWMEMSWKISIEWIRVEWLRLEWIRIECIYIYKYILNRYVLNGYVLNRYVLNEYVLNGYVLMRYVWNDATYDTPTVFRKTLRRNVFRDKMSGPSILNCSSVTKIRMGIREERYRNSRTIFPSTLKNNSVTWMKVFFLPVVSIPELCYKWVKRCLLWHSQWCSKNVLEKSETSTKNSNSNKQ